MTILIAVLFSLKGWTQLEIGMQNQQPIIPSWENYELMKYGKIGASMYTGTVNYSIPIYTYKDNDFEIPISINYATNGYRVNHSSGILGHGWSLYTPGVITRQVRGIPDERTDMELCHVIANFPTAVYLGYSNLSPNSTYSGEVMISPTGKPYMAKFRNNNNQVNTLYEVTQCFETDPDLFSFNFCGYSGSFSRNSNNRVINGSKFKVFEAEGKSRGLKIEMDDYMVHITITTPDGYRYIFDRDNEQDFFEDPESTYSYRVATSWILSCIIAPNNRSVTFIYEHNVLNRNYNTNTSYSYHPRTNHYFMQAPDLYTINSSTESRIDSTKNRVTRLSSIIFGDSVRMVFSYEAGESEMSTGNRHNKAPALCDNARLAEIKLLNGSTLIKTCHFCYRTSSANSPYTNTVTFLAGVNVSGEGSYHFEYNQEDEPYPCLGSTEFDHWGYYNGQGFPLHGYMTYIHQDSLTYDEHVAGIKDPSPDHCSRGTLNKITYPTGGYSLLEYEPHSYSRAVMRNSTSFFEPRLLACGEDKIAGGVRIKRIITRPSPAEPADTTLYLYNRGDSTSLSSGILLNTPRYGVSYTCGGYRAKIARFYDLSNQIYDYNRSHIEYSDVRMCRSDGWTDYHFTSSLSDSCMDYVENEHGAIDLNMFTNLDVPTAGVTTLGTFDCRFYESDLLVTLLLSPVTSLQFRRGRLEHSAQYSSDGQIQRETCNTYSFPSLGHDTIYHVAGESMACAALPLHNLEVASTTTTDFSGEVALSKTEKFEYNRIGLPTLVKTLTSRGDTVVTRSTYVVDTINANPGLNDQVINSMASDDLLGKLLGVETWRVNGSSDRLLSAARLTYYNPDPNNSRLACPSTKQEWISGNNWKTVEQYQFDSKGNLVEETNEESLTSTYLWSYGSRHIVSAIQNASKTQAETALVAVGLHSEDSLARMTNLAPTDFIKVRELGQNLRGSLQNAWRYRPLVGMIESAQPNHSVDTYHYDGYGRLDEMHDNKGKIVGQQEYNVVSVMPMTSSLLCDTLSLNNGLVAASLEAQGGSGSYSYTWQITDTSNHVIYTCDDSSISFEKLPGNYNITVCVNDLLTGESDIHTWLAAVPVRFTNIHKPETDVNGWTTVVADVTLGSTANLTFSADYQAPAQTGVFSTFKISIGNQTYNYQGSGVASILQFFPAGTTTVSISMYNASQGDATLTLTSAGNLAIGSPDILTFEMNSD